MMLITYELALVVRSDSWTSASCLLRCGNRAELERNTSVMLEAIVAEPGVYDRSKMILDARYFGIGLGVNCISLHVSYQPLSQEN